MSAALTLVVNPASGGGTATLALPAVVAELERRGREFELCETRSLADGAQLALSAHRAGRLPVAFGGDGHIGAIAAALCREPGAVLGILPGGRGNDLCRHLGIPLDPVAACAVLDDGAARAIDLGEANGVPFCGIASCGFDSEANRIANEAKLVTGQAVYAYAAARALLGFRPVRFDVWLDGEPEAHLGYSVAVANSSVFGGGMRVAPSASMSDGWLDVVSIAWMPRLRYVRLLPMVFTGDHIRRPEVRVSRAREVRIETSRPFDLYADGEQHCPLPVTVRVLPEALRLVRPS